VYAGTIMTPHDVVSHFGSQAEAARALRIERQVVHNWTARGTVPKSWQTAIEAMTQGALKRDTDEEAAA